MGLFGGMMGKRMGIGMPPMEDEERQGFWQGGDKFTGRDGIAGLMAVIGDALAQQGGGQGGATDMLGSGRFSALAMAKKAQEQQAARAEAEQAYRRLGLNDDQAMAASRGYVDYNDVAPKQQAEDAFIRRMRAANIDPSSPQGQALLRQKVAVEASPPPQLVGDSTMGWNWQTPPAPSLPGDMTQGDMTPMTEEEIRALGLPAGGPTRGASGGFPPRYRR